MSTPGIFRNLVCRIHRSLYPWAVVDYEPVGTIRIIATRTTERAARVLAEPGQMVVPTEYAMKKLASIHRAD